MSEQQSETSNKWGDQISPERQVELQGYLDRWEAEGDHGERTGPFARVPLSGADVYWMTLQLRSVGQTYMSNLHLEDAYLIEAQLKGAYFEQAHLEGAILLDAHLEDANLGLAYLEDAKLCGAKLENANLGSAQLGRVNFERAHLEKARMTGAQLESTNLNEAHLQCADLSGAYLKNANMRGAHLEGADLTEAHLDDADLNSAWFDKTTRLNDAILTGVLLDQVMFDQTNLTVVDWSYVTTLGDERTARSPRVDYYRRATRRPTQLDGYKAAVRANRLLAVALRNQGMNEDADRFAYRAQVLQQRVLWRQHKFGSYFFSHFLDGLVGYGYKPVRGLIAYILVIAGFAFAYGLATHGILTFGLAPSSIQPLQWYEALVLSISSFHGRGFFQPVQSLGDPVAIIAAAEAIIGLLIEISFIATFTQRFFGR